MGEWMPAEVYVRVPENFDIDRWLCPAAVRYHPDRHVLGIPHDAPVGLVVPAPVSDLVATATAAAFEWEWEPERRLLSDGNSDLEVNYGLGGQFADLADALRVAGWGYHFESSGKYELPGECWEWMPGWPTERILVQAGTDKALDDDCLRAALVEASALGAEPAEHLGTWLAPWPGWTTAADPDP